MNDTRKNFLSLLSSQQTDLFSLVAVKIMREIMKRLIVRAVTAWTAAVTDP